MIRHWKKWSSPTKIGFIGSLASIVGLLMVFAYPNQGQKQPSVSYAINGDKSPIIANNTGDVALDYSTKLQGTALLNTFNPDEVTKLKEIRIKYLASGGSSNWFGNSITAEIDGNQYLIVNEGENLCLKVFAEKDFDGNGSQDALIENIIGCGGNCCGDSYFFISYRGDGHFQTSDDFGYSWSTPKIEQWKGLTSVVVTSNNEGVNQDNPEEDFARYVLDSGKAVKVEESKRNEILALRQIEANEFDFDRDDQVISINYDINGDGIEDMLAGKLWHRWGRIFWYVQLSGGQAYESDTGCKRIGVLSSKTNGVNNLVCDQDDIFQWNGRKFE